MNPKHLLKGNTVLFKEQERHAGVLTVSVTAQPLRGLR